MFTTPAIMGPDVEFRNCVEGDVARHFQKIKEYIEPEFQDDHISKMKDCVEDGTAFVTKGDECFMYYKKTKEAFADAVSIYGKNYPLMMMAMIAGIPKHVPEDKKDTIFLYLTLHIGKDIKEYKGMLSKTAIYRHRTNGDRLLIRTDDLIRKFEKLRLRRLEK
jgi:hypothetical protein